MRQSTSSSSATATRPSVTHNEFEKQTTARISALETTMNSILSEVKTMAGSVNTFTARLDHLSSAPSPADGTGNTLSEFIPVKNYCGLLLLSDKLSTIGRMKHQLVQLCALLPKKAVAAAMDKLVSGPLCLQMSMKGKRTKYAFETTALCTLLKLHLAPYYAEQTAAKPYKTVGYYIDQYLRQGKLHERSRFCHALRIRCKKNEPYEFTDAHVSKWSRWQQYKYCCVDHPARLFYPLGTGPNMPSPVKMQPQRSHKSDLPAPADDAEDDDEESVPLIDSDEESDSSSSSDDDDI